MRRTALLLTLALAGCGGAAPRGIQPPATRQSTSTTSPAPVPRALAFVAPAAGGGTVRGADLAGKDVAVWLWAPW